MNAHPIFVYGTLRKGGSNHFRMDGSEYVGEGRISGMMYRIDWYPAVVCGGEGFVKGELYLVSDYGLKALDIFEGITPDADEAREYRRVKTLVRMESGKEAESWVWEWALWWGASLFAANCWTLNSPK